MNILVDRPQPVVDDIFVLMCLDSSEFHAPTPATPNC
jgi:hypothetical protein